MRICYIADSVSVHSQRWVNWFALRGHEVHLISRHFPGAAAEFDNTIRIHSLARLIPRYQASRVAVATGVAIWVCQVRSLLKQMNPDILHGHSVGVPGYLAAASGFHPLVLGAWGSDVLIDAKRSAVLRMLTAKALKKADRITSVSCALKAEIVKLTGTSDKVEVVRMGIDLQQFKPGMRDEALLQAFGSGSAPVVISTRNLKPIYDVETLVRAIPSVLKDMPGTGFIVVGDGEQRGFLQNLAHDLEVSDNVRFTGFLDPAELPSFLASSQVYVSTSLSDSLAVSTLEAMGCGVPVVVGDLPITREWISDGENGFIFPLRDHEALARKIVTLLRDDALRRRFGEAGRRAVEEKADREKEMPKLERIYSTLLHG